MTRPDIVQINILKLAKNQILRKTSNNLVNTTLELDIISCYLIDSKSEVKYACYLLYLFKIFREENRWKTAFMNYN